MLFHPAQAEFFGWGILEVFFFWKDDACQPRNDRSVGKERHLVDSASVYQVNDATDHSQTPSFLLFKA